jgi:hypothetical protein
MLSHAQSRNPVAAKRTVEVIFSGVGKDPIEVLLVKIVTLYAVNADVSVV